MNDLDIILFRSINGLAGQAGWLDVAGVFCSRYLLYVIIALVILQIWATSWRKESVRPAPFPDRLKNVMTGPLADLGDAGPLVAARALLAGILAWTVNQLFSLVLFRPRPFAVLAGVQRLIGEPAMDKSFPSDHSSLAFALAFSVALGRPVFGVVLLVLAVLIAASRVFVGVHYPLDVAAGLFVGLLWALVARRFVTKGFVARLIARFRRRSSAVK